MASDQRNIPVAEGDPVSISVNAGMLDGVLVKLPSGLTLANQQPGQPGVALVQVIFAIPVQPNGVMPGVFKLADLPGDKTGVVQ